MPGVFRNTRERGRARRRLRYLRRLRELQLRDAGGFVFDLYRFGERRDALVREKLDALIATDREIRSLEDLLGTGGRPHELRLPGIGGACAACGAFHGSDARFCASCGANLKAAASPGPAEHVEPAEPAEPPANGDATIEPPANGDVTIVRLAPGDDAAPATDEWPAVSNGTPDAQEQAAGER